MNEYERLDALYQRDQGVGVPYPETEGGAQLSLFDMEPKERHLGILELLHKTWVEKNERYGDSFSEVYDELGDISALTQVLHKVNRLKALVGDGVDSGVEESLDDTLLDLANYCVMWLMERWRNE